MKNTIIHKTLLLALCCLLLISSTMPVCADSNAVITEEQIKLYPDATISLGGVPDSPSDIDMIHSGEETDLDEQRTAKNSYAEVIVALVIGLFMTPISLILYR